MKTIYTICQEVNNNGFDNSDKCFINELDAIKYLRKVVASDILYYRRYGYKVLYLNVYSPNYGDTFAQTIEFGIKKGRKILRLDLRVKEVIVFENEAEFNRYPIQL